MADHTQEASDSSPGEANGHSVSEYLHLLHRNKTSDAMQAKLRSFGPRISHLSFEKRLGHNLDIEMAKPDGMRTLNALNCQALYFEKRISGSNKRASPDQIATYAESSPEHQVTTQLFIDIVATLNTLLRRTLCQAMMDRQSSFPFQEDNSLF